MSEYPFDQEETYNEPDWDEPEDNDDPPDPAFYTVAVYLIDRVRGGPEEGGWYYTAGELITDADFPIPRIVKTWEEATDARNEMQEELAAHNEGRRDISSVLSEGMYSAEIHAEIAPKYFPETRPYYE